MYYLRQMGGKLTELRARISLDPNWMLFLQMIPAKLGRLSISTTENTTGSIHS